MDFAFKVAVLVILGDEVNILYPILNEPRESPSELDEDRIG